MRKRITILSGLVITACQVSHPSVVPVHSASPSGNVPAPTPSVLPSLPPSSVTPSSPYPDAYITQYTPSIHCQDPTTLDLEEPELTEPRDIAVSPDGKKVYVTLNTPFVKAHTGNNTLPPHIQRTLIYLFSEGRLSVFHRLFTRTLSCGFNGEIEMQPNGHLLISYPEIDHQSTSRIRRPIDLPILAQKYYSLLENDIQLSATRTFNDEISKRYVSYTSSPAPHIYNLVRLHRDLQGNLYSHYLYTGEAGFWERYQLDSQKPEMLLQINDLLVNQFNGLGVIHSNQILRGGVDVFSSPFPRTTTDTPRSQFKAEQVRCPGALKQPLRPLSNGNAKADTQGNLYFTDIRGIIWKRSPDVIYSCLAGNTEPGYRDGTGAQARFNQPSELDIDAQGNIYVADTGNHAIRKITPEGTVTTLYKRGQ